MSIENNSSRSLDGLNSLSCDVINVIESIEINGDNGGVNQILKSDGTATTWAGVGDILADLSVSAPLTYTSGTTYDGGTARTLQIADDAIENVKLDNSTISGKELGTNLDALSAGFGITLTGGYDGSAAKSVTLTNHTISGVSLGGTLGALTINAPLTLSSGTTYDGSVTEGLTLDISNIANSDLANSTISSKALGTNLDTLSAGSGITLSGGYNGAAAKTVSLTNSTISGVSLGSNLADLTGGSGISMSSYNGGTARSISLTLDENTIDINSGEVEVQKVPNALTINAPLTLDSGTTYDGSGAKTLDIANIANSDLANSTISGVALGSNLETLSAGANITLSGGYNGGAAKSVALASTVDSTTFTNANLLNENNLILPPNIYYDDSKYKLSLDAGMFHPNDDSTYYNYSIDDDGTYTTGKGQIKSTSIEICGIIRIPKDWVATGTFIDVRDSSGDVVTSSPPTYQVWKIQTSKSGGTIASRVDMTGMYASAINTENDFVGGNTFTGTYDEALCIVIGMNSTTIWFSGGYVILDAPGGH